MPHFEMYNVSHDVHICASGVHTLHYVKKCGHGACELSIYGARLMILRVLEQPLLIYHWKNNIFLDLMLYGIHGTNGLAL